jgi:acyl carrier protein
MKDPFVEEGRMYRTGDLGRWREDGSIEFLGRNDFQVKVRGFRIELGEIEARIAEQEGVREAAVALQQDEAGDKRLVAYYTCNENVEALEVEQLRSALAGTLPEYMVPALFVRLESLPLTSQGILDRKALPCPEEMQGYEAPAGEMEQKVAAIWAEILELEQIGRRDNFFDVGGHSLLAVQIVSRLQKALNVDVTVDDVFARPVLKDLSQYLESATQLLTSTIVQTERTDRIPLSLTQRRL